ncbi:hypothetical protein SAMD00019534_012580, partial [Acytostelium subglobosum LB1]|uniref:hypothetical protein n=1 Tax=Acytostelium subglobosum LB1 TaxID=1410327 RepID=UPI000644F4E7
LKHQSINQLHQYTIMTTDINIEETFKRILGHKGVKGILIINKSGSVIKSTFDSNASLEYSKMVIDIFPRATALLKQNNNSDEASFFRVRSKDTDIMITPDNDYFLMVVNQISH